MHEPRFKPLLAWEPFPYIALFVLAVVTGSIRPERAPVAFWIFLSLTVIAAVYFVIALVRDSRAAKRNPNAWGDLRTIDGLSLVDAAHQDSELKPTVAVDDVHRHQASIEIIRTHGGEHIEAILVPRASRWLSLRYRIGVQLVTGTRVRHAGFIPEIAHRRWVDQLGALRRDGSFVRVPARIRGTERPYRVDIDISGLAQLLD